MEQQDMLMKILQMTQETNTIVRDLQKEIEVVKAEQVQIRQDMMTMEERIRQDMTTMEERIRQDMAAMEERINLELKDIRTNILLLEAKVMTKIDAEVKDAVKDHNFIIKNLSNVMTHLQLEVI